MLKRKFKVDWDTDEYGEDIGLPNIVDVPYFDPDGYPVTDVSDWLSEMYGWLVLNLEEILEEK